MFRITPVSTVGDITNVTYLNVKSLVHELRAIRLEISRLADCWEAELADKGYHVRPPKADTTGPEPTISYVDEELDYVRELKERLKREEEADEV